MNDTAIHTTLHIFSDDIQSILGSFSAVDHKRKLLFSRNIKLSAKGVLEDNALVILCEDKMTAILAAKEPTISVIREQAAKLNGAPIKVKVREAGEELVVKKNIAVDELIDRAKSMDIQVKQL